MDLQDSSGYGIPFRPAQALIAGWTARDEAKVRHHIEELEELGVKPPSTVPLYYRVSASLFTTNALIETVGPDGAGEVEPVLFDDGDRLWLGVGSDHTDRALEAHSVVLSKQVCAKPVASRVWSFEEVEPHLDRIEFRSWIRNGASEAWVLYQEGCAGDVRPLRQLADASPHARGGGRLAAGTVMMCGTFGVVSGGVRPAPCFRMEMKDPVLDRSIMHEYAVSVLPLVA